MIMPFIQALGYNVFSPLEVIPEFTCDIGTKKGEKIDYAITKDGSPIILIECKYWKQDLTLYDNQLLRYFHLSNAKFGVLTNGIIFRFYTDPEIPNKMDEKPFLEIDLLDIRNSQIEELKKFHKTYFDIDNILSSASELKYTRELKSILTAEFSNPSPEFVKLFARQVYDGMMIPKILEQFTTLMRKSISGLISEIISERLNSALKTEASETHSSPDTTDSLKNEEEKENENKVVTTMEEMEGYFIVKAILRSSIPSDRATYRDALTYFSIFIDDNNRKPICRLYLNSSKNKMIALFDENKKELKYKISNLDDIYNYTEDLISTAKRYV